MNDNWIIKQLENSLGTWNEKLAELWQLVTQTPESFKGGGIWNVVVNINGGLKAIGYGLLVLFFVTGVMKTAGSFTEIKRPEQALKLFLRFALAKAAISHCMDLMLAMFHIAQGAIATVMNSSGLGTTAAAALPDTVRSMPPSRTAKQAPQIMIPIRDTE